VNEPIDHAGVVTPLPRGGFLVRTSEGNFQFGAPPETIKDTIPTEDSVPKVFVLPRELFNWQKGINVADMEFPIYFNFFLKKQKVTVLADQQQVSRLSTAMQQAVFGPSELDLHKDAYPAQDDVFVPDLTGELGFFRGKLTLSDLVEFYVFNDGRVEYGAVAIQVTRDENYQVYDKNTLIAEIPGRIAYTPKYAIGERLPEPFIPPRFGVTCLGPSHGFDPTDNTSGFIIWLNGNGIMVDPPVNSTEWLERSNVNPKFIDSIILTHAHADHDAGTFQKILEESRVTIYTTPTVMGSFLTKYAAFSGESAEFLQKLFTYHPVYMGRPFYLHGGEFQVYYSVHSIPTMGFRLRFQDKTFVYSSDHQAEPDVQKRMLDEGVISQRRYEQLRAFPWDSDVIYHEGGMPPLHTPISYLNSLPREIQKKIVVYHIARKDFPEPKDTDLTLATFGIENTLYFETEPTPYEEAYRTLDVLKHLDFFRVLAVGKVQEFLSVIDKRHYRRGEKIIQKGTKGENFFIIQSGNARIDSEELVRSKYLGAYEYFGELALLTGADRAADIVAETDVDLLAIEKSRFINFIAGTEFERVLKRLIQSPREETWNLLTSSSFFTPLTDYQKMWLESVLSPEERDGPDVILEEGQDIPGVYVIREGQVRKSLAGRTVSTLGPGDVIGMLHKIQRGEPADYTFSHAESLSLFFIDKNDVIAFLKRNPGTAMRLAYR